MFKLGGWRLPVALLSLLVTAPPAWSGFEDLKQEVREINLDNGLKILLLERHDVPVFSFWTYVNVGAVDEHAGKTGIAHMFEHMAFKGTQELGSLDYKKEVAALQRLDDVYALLQAERFKRERADSTRIAELQGEFERLQADADKLVDTNAFDRVVEENGGVDINAETSWDATQYYYSLPSNMLELWVLLESDRFISPVLREFYKERSVILEERNMRTDSQPQGRLFEEWMALCYLGHPYGQSLIGYRSDIEAYSRRDAEEFYSEHYGARNMVISVVGDVYYDDLKRLAEKYFAKIPPGQGPVTVRTIEPRQLGERRVVIEENTQPFLLIGYHVPKTADPDTPAYMALADVLGQGRSSRLYTRLVKNEQLALQTASFMGLPGDRYPRLLTLFAIPNKGIATEDVEAAIYEEAQRIVDSGITDEELQGFKTRARSQFVQGLDSNMGLAGQLCWAQMIFGDWRELFNGLAYINAVTAADVQRVAAKTFVKSNRSVGVIKTLAQSS